MSRAKEVAKKSNISHLLQERGQGIHSIVSKTAGVASTPTVRGHTHIGPGWGKWGISEDQEKSPK
jgi:hypothetical protein